MAGCFEHINNRKDFAREIDRALIPCRKHLKTKGANNTLLSVAKQLELVKERRGN